MVARPSFGTRVITNDKILQPLLEFTNKELFVGITEPHTGRSPGPGREGQQPTNAQIAYWMENGTTNAPARPFLEPAIDAVRDSGFNRMVKDATKKAANGDGQAIELMYRKIGVSVVMTAKSWIEQAIDMDPLAASTVKNRERRNNMGYLAGVKAPFLKKDARDLTPGIADPLLDTKQMYNAISYSIRTTKGGGSKARARDSAREALAAVRAGFSYTTTRVRNTP